MVEKKGQEVVAIRKLHVRFVWIVNTCTPNKIKSADIMLTKYSHTYLHENNRHYCNDTTQVGTHYTLSSCQPI